MPALPLMRWEPTAFGAASMAMQVPEFCWLSLMVNLGAAVREQEFAAQTPELVAGNGDEDNDNDDCEDEVSMAASFGSPDEPPRPYWGRTTTSAMMIQPAANAIYSAEMIPDIRLRNRKQNIPDQLPAGGAFSHSNIEECVGHIGNVLDYQRQQSHKTADEKKTNFLGLSGTEQVMLSGMKTTIGT